MGEALLTHRLVGERLELAAAGSWTAPNAGALELAVERIAGEEPAVLIRIAAKMYRGRINSQQLKSELSPSVIPTKKWATWWKKAKVAAAAEARGSFVVDAQAAIDEKVEMPPGYLVKWGGQFELQQQANKRLMLVVPITLLVVFLLLYSNFNSLRSSLLIVLNIPLALVGGVVALWMTGQNLSVPASVGFIALFGISVMDGVVLIEHIRNLRHRGLGMNEAVHQGALDRLRPVLMTTATDALGFIPMALSTSSGAEVQRPLATVVIGGVLTASTLTLVVLPAVYHWFEPKREEEVEV